VTREPSAKSCLHVWPCLLGESLSSLGALRIASHTIRTSVSLTYVDLHVWCVPFTHSTLFPLPMAVQVSLLCILQQACKVIIIQSNKRKMLSLQRFHPPLPHSSNNKKSSPEAMIMALYMVSPRKALTWYSETPNIHFTIMVIFFFTPL